MTEEEGNGTSTAWLPTNTEQTGMSAQANSSLPLAAPPEPLSVDTEQSTHALAFVPGLSHQYRLVVTCPFNLALLPLTFFFFTEKQTLIWQYCFDRVLSCPQEVICYFH